MVIHKGQGPFVHFHHRSQRAVGYAMRTLQICRRSVAIGCALRTLQGLTLLAIVAVVIAPGFAQTDRMLAPSPSPPWAQPGQAVGTPPDQGSRLGNAVAQPIPPFWLPPGRSFQPPLPYGAPPAPWSYPSQQAPAQPPAQGTNPSPSGPWGQGPQPVEPNWPTGQGWGPQRFGPWGPASPSTPPQRAQPPVSQPPVSPSRPDWPGMAPSWQQPASPPSGPRAQGPGPFQAPSAWTPRLDWSIETSDPYLQQPVLIRLEVTSSDDPGTLSLELPTTDDALLKVFSGPTSDIRFEQTGQQISKRFILTLTPLRTGDLALPPIRVKGTLGFGQSYELMTDPIRLQVRPPMPSVRPWLPLKSLTLSARLDREGPVTPGQPLTLAIELAATGGTAIQLPSLEKQLAAPGLKVYREQALTDTRLSADGTELIASRTEYYTLIPQNSGRLSLPELGIAWWNLERGVREVARLSPIILEVRGGPLQQALAWLAAIAARLWLPLAAILLVLGSYWVGARYRGRLPELGRDLLHLTLRGAAWGWRQLSAWGAPLARALAPAPVFRRLHRLGLHLLPEQRRLILKLRHAEGAKTPEDWYRRLMQTDLLAPGALTRPGLLARVLHTCPKADPQALARLLSQLDAAIYGREPLDFARWKRDWRRQVRGGCRMPLARTGRWLRRTGLPPLNPR